MTSFDSTGVIERQGKCLCLVASRQQQVVRVVYVPKQEAMRYSPSLLHPSAMLHPHFLLVLPSTTILPLTKNKDE